MRSARTTITRWAGTCAALSHLGHVGLAMAQAEGTPAAAEAADRKEPTPEPPPLVVTGKFGDGVAADTPDGEFGLRIGARAQVRSTVGVPVDEDEDVSVGAQIRRMRLTLDGHGFGQVLTLKIQFAFSPLDQDPQAPSAVRDAFFTWAPLRDFNLRFGQQKVPFGRQRVISSGAQQLVDRSIVTAELNLDRDVGFVAMSDDLGGLGQWLGYRLGIFGGDGRNRMASGSGLLYAARLELRPAGGGANPISEADLERSARPRLTIAASAAFNHATDRERSTIGPIFETGAWADYVHAGGDWTFQFRGLTVAGELFMRDAVTDQNTAFVDGDLAVDSARTGWGGFLQAGQMLGDHVELAARTGTVLPLGDSPGTVVVQREIGGGVATYLVGHALKLNVDYFHLFGNVAGDGLHQVRLQVQVAP